MKSNCWLGLLIGCTMLPAVHAASPAELYFREDFQPSPPATPITQEHVVNSQLTMHLYGAGSAFKGVGPIIEELPHAPDGLGFGGWPINNHGVTDEMISDF